MTRTVLAGILLALLLVLEACGASAIGAQADTIAVTGAVVSEADEIIVTSRARDLDEVVQTARRDCAAGCDAARMERDRAELADREAKWAPVLAARDLVVVSLRAWLDGLRVAEAAHTESFGLALLLRLGARVVEAYGTLLDVLATVAPDVHLPGLPGELPGDAS